MKTCRCQSRHDSLLFKDDYCIPPNNPQEYEHPVFQVKKCFQLYYIFALQKVGVDKKKEKKNDRVREVGNEREESRKVTRTIMTLTTVNNLQTRKIEPCLDRTLCACRTKFSMLSMRLGVSWGSERDFALHKGYEL